MEAEPSWSALEAWQVEQPAAFFCLDTGSPPTSKLEHADSLTRYTVTFGTVPSHPSPCWPSSEEGALLLRTAFSLLGGQAFLNPETEGRGEGESQ